MALGSEWTRVHPASPFLKAGRFGVVAVIFLFQQGAARAEPIYAAVGLVVSVVLGLVGGYLSWRMTGYRLDGAHLEFKTGLLRREHRRVPLARIEAVDVAQPVLPRLLGLSEIRVQSAASDDSELSLQYLSEATAWKLRDQLRVQVGLVAPKSAPVSSGESVDGNSTDASVSALEGESEGQLRGDADNPTQGRTIFSLSTGELVMGYLVARVVVPIVLLAVALAVVTFVDPSFALTGSVPMLIGAASVIINGLRTTETMYGFTLYEHQDGLFIHRGLLNKFTQRVTLDRVQSVGVQQPWLWRKAGRGRLVVDIAGYRGQNANEAEQTALLVPIARYEECLAVLDRVLPGLSFSDVDLHPAPSQARWLEPAGARFLMVGLNERCMVSRHGLLRRHTVVTPHDKVQSWRISAGPWQRRLGLSTLSMDTAGSHLVFQARFRSTAEARGLLDASRRMAQLHMARSKLQR